MGENPQYMYKLVLLGDSGVGKSNLLKRFTQDEFEVHSKSTVGVEFAYRSVAVSGVQVRAQVWDTAGQERFRAVAPMYYRGAKGVVLVYDVTKRESFARIERWMDEVKMHAESDIRLLLVGNKCDLVFIRSVSTEEGAQYAAENELAFIETSACDGTNVDAAFERILGDIHLSQTTSQAEDSCRRPPVVPAGVSVPIGRKAAAGEEPSKASRCSC
eukprot:TRINITY_DN2891_c3_g1_i1.p1 TRINITY_DN2891_c3_g1~~TRINITY_DN2891_c3_g1_i1.p1  ORF type:complete len:215 (+),score=27.31 TRINITY_DN2891_c3_g1_i1:96-740(+)